MSSKALKSRLFQVNDKVLARKKPRSRYYDPGMIVATDGDNYQVQFDDGEEYILASKAIQKYSRKLELENTRKSKSRSPSRSSGGRRSRSRSTSLSRKETKPKSPKSPKKRTTNKSPETKRGRPRRAAAEPKAAVKELTPVVQIQQMKMELSETEPETEDDKIPNSLKTSTPIKETRKRTVHKTTEEVTATRSSARLAGQKLEMLKDDIVHKPRPVTTKREMLFGGAWGTLVSAFVFVGLILGVNLACRRTACTILSVPQVSTNWKVYLDPLAAGVYVGFCLLQFLLLAVPLGRVSQAGTSKFRCNGWFAALVTASIMAGLIYFKVPLNVVYGKFFALITTSLLVSFFLSVILYISGRHATAATINPHGNAGRMFYDWFVGRELNPMLKQFHLKLFVLRAGLLGWAVIDFCLLWKSFVDTRTVSPTLSVAAACQMWLILDFLLHEDDIQSSLVGQFEGLGFVLIAGFLSFVPFTFSLSVRFVHTYKTELDWPYLVLIGLLFGTGYLINRLSNNQKNGFRRDPKNPKYAHLETMETGRGKKLLISGWWGWLRHPNYLGELLMGIAWTLPCGFTHVLPWFYVIYLIPTLIHRSILDDTLCAKKYGSIWNAYKQKVKYRIIPKVF